MAKFYDGTKLLSMKDINGNKPEIYICTSNRSAGKTTYFARLLVNRFIKNKSKFMLVYRFNYELDNVADKFFKDIKGLFFQEHDITSSKMAKGTYHELFFDGESCGYAVALNNADQLKKLSHLFSDTQSMMFDEFQSETNHYCSKEIEKLISIHTSIARGQGEQARYVPIYMISNPVSLINPYYTALGISSRLNKNTNFLKGDGFVLEQGFNESASQAQSASAFNRAFGNSQYMAYNTQAVYLNDSQTFIEVPEGKGKYMMTLRYHGTNFGVWRYDDAGVIFINQKADGSFPIKIAITTEDHQVNYVMLKNNDAYIQALRYFFERGCLRFKDLSSKEAVLTAIGYY